MIKEAIGLGSTMEEAKENAILKLGASEFDDVQFEVIAMPKKKVLGLFGGSDAQVRAYIEVPEKKVKNNKNKPAKNKNNNEKVVEKAAENEDTLGAALAKQREAEKEAKEEFFDDDDDMLDNFSMDFIDLDD